MSHSDPPDSQDDDLQWGRRVREPRLTPEDFELALRRMKRDLALTGLRRSLEDPTLDAEEVLSIVRQIIAIQTDEQEERAQSAATEDSEGGLGRILHLVATGSI